jgi:hypothetical protein
MMFIDSDMFGVYRFSSYRIEISEIHFQDQNTALTIIGK